MAIVLVTENLPARVSYQGSTAVTLPAGKHIIVETSPNGDELLDAEVPAGKTWVVTVNVHIQET